MSALARHLGQAHDMVTRAGFGLAQLCLVVIVGAYCFETVSRYFFAAPTSWSNEVVAYALCIGTFLALPEVTRTGGHVAITILTDILPRGARAGMERAMAFLAAATCLLVAWICLDTSLSQIERGEMLVRVNPMPKAWISLWLVYGFAGCGLHFLRQAMAGQTDVNGASQY
ncbi:TRAP transporter small permease [Loktanella sp. M215]|uniref:TRAP transporter small permease n=1 Tax=Loktanella sp. M215 TaxID=2675431 RepID=UPI001F3B5DB4|nr:TRAP transporter small permease [Loktanella sp. M215]MCF7701779.1 TRAP transporter small permease subunit [Loktanella sp. M215]